MKRILAVLTACILSSIILFAQEKDKIYFVDGFHGGVYGHYPMMTYTDYMVGLIAKYPEWSMCLEIEPETWDTVKTKTPESYERFKKIAGDNRVEFTNPTYAQPYMYNISGESIIRQFQYGIKKVNDHFPDVGFVTYAVEEPCFTSALPQILRQLGIKYASLKCPDTCWGGYAAPYGGELVNWIGPDGSSILTSPRYECEELQDGTVWQTTAWGNCDDYIAACRNAGIKNIVGMCYQDAGWTYGPWIGYGDSVRNGSEYVTWKEYFENKTSGWADDDYRFSQEDVRPALMWGSQVLQKIARQVRYTENNIIRTEKIGLISGLSNGYQYNQSDVDEAWRTLMLAQHHDSWIVPYNGLNDKGTWADNIALWTSSSDALCGDIMKDIESKLHTGVSSDVGRFGLRVINTSAHARKEVVSVDLPEWVSANCFSVRNSDGKKVQSIVDITMPGRKVLSFMAETPAFGYSVYSVEQAVSNKEKRISGCRVVRESVSYKAGQKDVVVETDMYRLVLDSSKGGIIKSLVLKGEQSAEFADLNAEYGINELRGYFYEEGRYRSSAETPAQITVTDLGLKKIVSVRGMIASVPFTQILTLCNGERKIDVDLRIDWKDNIGIGKFAQKGGFKDNKRACYNDRYKLNVMFPVSVEKPEIYKNAPFDVCKSRLEDTFFDTWDGIKHNVILDWVDLSGEGNRGFAVFSDHTTSYSHGAGNPLALTVQYSGGGLWGRDYPINGASEIRYAIMPHYGKWDAASIEKESRKWSEPLVCMMSDNKNDADVSFVDIDDDSGYEISAAYKVGDGFILRLYNAAGDEKPVCLSFGLPVSEIVEVDLKDNDVASYPIEMSDGKSAVKLSMPRFGIRTYKIKY